MINSKYNKVLTVVLVIVVIIIFALLGFWGYQTYRKYFQERDIDTALEEFNQTITNSTRRNEFTGSDPINFTAIDNGVSNESTSGGSSNGVVTYKGFTVMGRMEIPKIDLDLPILERATRTFIRTIYRYLNGTRS